AGLSRQTRLDPAQAAALRGTVFLEGQAPAPRPLKIDAFPACMAHHEKPPVFENFLVEDGRVRNVVVYLRRGLPQGMTFPAPGGRPGLDQEGCVFVPHVQVVRAGQTVLVDSADEEAHNIRTLSRRNPALNFNMPPHEKGRTLRFDRAEMPPVKVKCDVHPWMGAWIAVLDHPFAAVTAADGTFEIRGIPPGEYTVRAWHEELGTLEKKVALAPRAEATLDFTLKAPSED
ncbi:MAG: carboxypeptidase regulatory-like domain-containing protein, partial [Planctomycetota bacterium]